RTERFGFDGHVVACHLRLAVDLDRRVLAIGRLNRQMIRGRRFDRAEHLVFVRERRRHHQGERRNRQHHESSIHFPSPPCLWSCSCGVPPFRNSSASSSSGPLGLRCCISFSSSGVSFDRCRMKSTSFQLDSPPPCSPPHAGIPVSLTPFS